MKGFKLSLALLFVFSMMQVSHALIITESLFGFKGPVLEYFHALGEERFKFETIEESNRVWKFRYKGKEYTAQLFVHGAIYLTTPGENPRLISIEIKRFKTNTFVNPLRGVRVY